jgi:hypothetical protein
MQAGLRNHDENGLLHGLEQRYRDMHENRSEDRLRTGNDDAHGNQEGPVHGVRKLHRSGRLSLGEGTAL